MNRNIIIVIVLVVLVLLTAIQAVQLSNLTSQIKTGNVGVGSGQTPIGGQGVPSNIQDLPPMVGGC